MSSTTQCHVCKHHTGVLQCAAFPEGIPEPILTGEFDHSVKFPRQKNDILFEHEDGLEGIVIDTEFQIPVFSPVCHRCLNLTDGHGRKCKAFPDEIPYDIWIGENPHTTRHQEQENGILFEGIP